MGSDTENIICQGPAPPQTLHKPNMYDEQTWCPECATDMIHALQEALKKGSDMKSDKTSKSPDRLSRQWVVLWREMVHVTSENGSKAFQRTHVRVVEADSGNAAWAIISNREHLQDQNVVASTSRRVDWMLFDYHQHEDTRSVKVDY